MLIVIYGIILFILTIYSYCLVDPSLTLFNTPTWDVMRTYLINIGYFQRSLSSTIYMSLLVAMFIGYWFLVKQYKKVSVLHLSLVVGILCVFSYPFLSRDIFNYMFDAKILTFYHQNPYLMRGLDFPNDHWLRFMHWTHRTYPYGPTFLPFTLIPAFLGMGKFIIHFFLYKAMTVIFYFISVYVLQKMNKKWAIIFAASPYIIIEGLINAHNDFMAVSLSLVGIYFLYEKRFILGRLFLILSGGIKYITIPLIALSRDNKIYNLFVYGALGLLLVALITKMEIQQWYFLVLFTLLPSYEHFVYRLQVFFAGLLLSYIPFLLYGNWNAETLAMKHQIILIATIINAVSLAYEYREEIKKLRITDFKLRINKKA